MQRGLEGPINLSVSCCRGPKAAAKEFSSLIFRQTSNLRQSSFYVAHQVGTLGLNLSSGDVKTICFHIFSSGHSDEISCM